MIRAQSLLVSPDPKAVDLAEIMARIVGLDQVNGYLSDIQSGLAVPPSDPGPESPAGPPGSGRRHQHFTLVAEGYGVPSQQAKDADELRAVLAESPIGPRLVQVDTALTAPS